MPKKIISSIVCMCLLVMITCLIFPLSSFAKEKSQKIRVGYYENEVFQEGAEDGAVKSGYAYEY